VLRVILLDTRYRHSSTIEITKEIINESLAHPRDIFRPVIGQSAYAFVLVHNQPSGDPAPSEADCWRKNGRNGSRFASLLEPVQSVRRLRGGLAQANTSFLPICAQKTRIWRRRF
jgi:RadC-like JAB domain-containing protein